MFDLSSITAAKKKAEDNYQKHAGDYDTEYQAALEYLNDFTRNPTDLRLRMAASKFFEAIRCKRTSIEPYCYLSYIFFIFDKKEVSLEYLRYAESIDQHFHLLGELREMLYSN